MFHVMYVMFVGLCSMTFTQSASMSTEEIGLELSRLASRYDQDMARMDAEHQQLHKRIHNLESQVKVMEKRIELQNSTNFNLVGFTAYATRTVIYAPGTIIVFDGMVTEIGAGYSPTTGVFTCPQTGYYLFSCTLHAEDPFADVYAEILIDGETLVIISNFAGESQVSNSVLVECEQFSQVAVRAIQETEPYGNEGYPESTFTGTLISTV